MEIKASPRISVVIPVYNTERYVGEAIESALSQSLPPFEVIVVDDGSTDGSLRSVKMFEGAVTVIDLPHSGIGAARNAGAAAARGDLLAFLDADDLWPRDSLEVRFAALNEGVDYVFGYAQNFLTPEHSADPASPHPTLEITSALLAGSILVRTELFRRIGPFRCDFSVGEFIDWVSRARNAGCREAIVPQLVLRRRVHGSNTVLRGGGNADYLRIARENLKRKRERSTTPC